MRADALPDMQGNGEDDAMSDRPGTRERMHGLERELAEARAASASLTESNKSTMERLTEARADLNSARSAYTEMQLTFAGMEAERDHYRSALAEVTTERDEALANRDQYRERAWRAELLNEQRVALRRDLEALLGVESGPASDEQFERGVAAVKALIAERDAARADLETLRADYDRLAQVTGTPKVCETCDKQTRQDDTDGEECDWCDEHQRPCDHFALVGQPSYCGAWEGKPKP